MAKTAPDDYPYIPSGKLFPLEPVLEGGSATPRGWQDLAQGINHVIRSLTPTVIVQHMQFFEYGVGGSYYLTTDDQAVETNYATRLVYRFPTVAGIKATPTVSVRGYCEAAAGATGNIRFNTASGAAVFAVVNNGAWTLYTDTVQYSTAAAFDTLWIETQRTGGSANDDVAMKSLSVHITRGDNPQPLGMDVEPWTDDEPAAVYMQRMAKDRLDDTCKERPGVVVAYSEDIENLAKPAPFLSTAATLQIAEDLQSQYGPLTKDLRIHVNGYNTAGAAQGGLRVWTDYSGYAAAADLVLPEVAAFNAISSWVTDTVEVAGDPLASERDARKGSATVYLELYATTGTTNLSGLSIWEEPR